MNRISFTLAVMTVALIIPGFTGCVSEQPEAKPEVIAHRGYWKTDQSAQNSTASFQKAIELDCYGSEMDLYLTSDNRIVLFHDNRIKLIENGQEVSKRVDSCSYEELADYTLSNGEKLPLFEDILEIAKAEYETWNSAGSKLKKGDVYTKPILEIKTHSTVRRDIEAVHAIHKMVTEYGLEDKVEYIAFSHNICAELIAIATTTPVHYLNGDLTPMELKEKGFSGLDYNISIMKKNNTWFEEARQMGLKVNVWTVNSEEDMVYLMEKGIDFVTTDEPVMMKSIISGNTAK
jgi:glycerophosphoryl diester phosphodiesterase